MFLHSKPGALKFESSSTKKSRKSSVKMRGRGPTTTSYYSPVFMYSGGKPMPKRGNEKDNRPAPTVRRITGHEIRDPICGKGNLGSEADLIYAGPSGRPKSPPVRRAPRPQSKTRDPIRGAGELGEEHDPFQRTAKVRKVVGGSQNTRGLPISARDPVRGTGNLGPELDHLNRSPKADRKAGKARPREESYRDPIKGQGSLQCYDKFRNGPEKAKVQKYPQQKVRRDPIKGEGDISEFDRITNGPRPTSAVNGGPRPVSPRYSCKPAPTNNVFGPAEPERKAVRQSSYSANKVHRDPIKGQGDFSTELKSRGKKPGTPRPQSGGRNPISGSTDIENTPPCGQHHRRHIGRSIESDPIRGTGADLHTYDIARESRAKTQRPRSALVQSNPLSGENCASFDIHTNMKTKSRGQYYSRATVKRNPLTGENCEDYILGSTMTSKRRHIESSRAPCNPLTGENCATYTYATDARSPRAGNGSNVSNRSNRSSSSDLSR